MRSKKTLLFRRPALVLALTAPMAVSASPECPQCHEVDHTAIAASAEPPACVGCHDAPPHGERLTGTVTARSATLTVPAAPDATLGMSTPRYYPGSRLGSEPNPMVNIPAGAFTMGTDERLADEGPAHILALPAYAIDRYEVTNLQYARFVAETGQRAPEHFEGDGPPRGKADHPVTFVTWHDAQAYCHWAGKRLPTEAEWEKAARGPDGRTFAWGDEFDIAKANTPVRWERLGVEGDTTPVGAFEAGVSPFGLYDMSGNVWEWTASWYGPHPGNTVPSENFGEKYKVLKGGSWWDCSFYKCGISAPVYNRSFFNPKLKNASFGFRCARDVP